ncbi:MAG: AAA family ATPase [Plectolyngbya sp. WJT66-NPBG17]|jgi:hypothetical protein|nr:AAA family ATPase [Plectolyngbya sp. WJT66-NPBG17]
MTSSRDRWLALNQQYLMAALAEIHQVLEQRLGQSSTGSSLELSTIASEMQDPPAIEALCTSFGLTSFERQLLLLCAGVELDASIASTCAALQGDPRHPYVTFSLALSCLPDSHWSALYPARPLRQWHFIEVASSGSLTRNPLQISERVLHYLTGGQDLDMRLSSLVERVPIPQSLVPSHQALAERLTASWITASARDRLPVVQLCGDDSGNQWAIAARACASLGLNLHVMPAHVLPSAPQDLETLARLWEREAALSQSALLLDCRSHSDSSNAIAQFIEKLNSGLIIANPDRRHLDNRTLVTLDVHSPTTQEQEYVWRDALNSMNADLNGTITALVSQFNFSSPTIRAICTETQLENESEIASALWNNCRLRSRPRLEDLAQRIQPAATWEELVLPDPEKQLLQEIAMHVRQRMTVYETWGFASKGSRGLGISALFAGLSGTGKTMAAEVLAHELHLDLYRIDLSAVVSKYIGETEKNLRRVFDTAEQGGAILLFDEADALFGKRSEVKDSHDRHANIEVSYLLQRMEAYRGLAILTTNLKNALDTAFLRRIRFIVQFPFPDATQRADIWQHIFPTATPMQNLDVHKLARLNASGGNIHNMAVYAAFLAAEEREAVQMKHLLRAARVEFAKFEKSPTEAETQGWIA